MIENDFVISAFEGDIGSPQAFTKAFSSVAKAAGVGLVSFHGLRHTHTSPLLREAVPEDMLPTRWTPPGATRYKTERQENARS